MSIMPLYTYINALFIRYPGNKNNEDSLLNVTFPLILLETEEYVLWYQIIILRQVNIKISFEVRYRVSQALWFAAQFLR